MGLCIKIAYIGCGRCNLSLGIKILVRIIGIGFKWRPCEGRKVWSAPGSKCSIRVRSVTDAIINEATMSIENQLASIIFCFEYSFASLSICFGSSVFLSLDCSKTTEYRSDNINKLSMLHISTQYNCYSRLNFAKLLQKYYS